MILSLKQIRRTVFILIILVIVGAGGFLLGGHKSEKKYQSSANKIEIINSQAVQEKSLDFNLFWQVWNKLEQKYLEKNKLDKEKMFYGAIQGMTAALGDPYTVFLTPEQNKQVKDDLNGSFEGVGIRLGFNKDKRLVVVAPLKGMAAEAAGVRAGDVILHLKDDNKELDENTFNMTLPEAVEKIRGEKGTKIILTLWREGENEDITAEIVRQTIIVPSVEVEFLNSKGEKVEQEGQFAHLKLTSFGDRTAEEWDQSVAKIIERQEGLKGIILDVRGNPGGYLHAAVNLTSEFLSKGIIVKQENYKGEIETYSVNRKGRLLTMPIIVLIDKGSASASEILAGALRDHKRAKLVGENTFGKGTIQEVEDVDNDSSLHITTAKWLTPNDFWVNEIGLKPDFEIGSDKENPDNDLQLNKAIELLVD